MVELETKTSGQIVTQYQDADWIGGNDGEKIKAFHDKRWVSLDSLKALLAEQRKALNDKIHKNGRSSGCLRDVEELLCLLEERLR